MRRKLVHRNYLSWDVGVIRLEVGGRSREAVVIVESSERRFFPVASVQTWREAAIRALESRFRAVGWWGIPRQIQVDLPEMVEVIRGSERLDDCEIVVVDALISMRWARIAAAKILAGDKEREDEYVIAA